MMRAPCVIIWSMSRGVTIIESAASLVLQAGQRSLNSVAASTTVGIPSENTGTPSDWLESSARLFKTPEPGAMPEEESCIVLPRPW